MSKPQSSSEQTSRRGFISKTAATIGAVGTYSIANSAIANSPKSYSRIVGANDRLGVANIGCGGIAQSHAESIKAIKEKQNLDRSPLPTVGKNEPMNWLKLPARSKPSKTTVRYWI